MCCRRMTHVKSVTLVIFCYVNSDTGSLGVCTTCRFFPSSYIHIPWLYRTCEKRVSSSSLCLYWVCSATVLLCIQKHVAVALCATYSVKKGKQTDLKSKSKLHSCILRVSHQHRRLHSLKLKHCVLGGGQITNAMCKVDWESESKQFG